MPMVPVVCTSGTVLAVLPTLQQQHGGDGRRECQPGDAHSLFPFQQQTGCWLSRAFISPQGDAPDFHQCIFQFEAFSSQTQFLTGSQH